MADLPVFDRSGKEVGSYSIEWTDIAPKINKQLLHDAVVMYQANLRLGTFGSKSRGQVVGSGQKMYRQKGTGHARAGSSKVCHRRGGGHAFAKHTRDFSYRLPKKAVRSATRMAIASKLRDAQVVVVDELTFEAPKTREMSQVLIALGLGGSTALVATAGNDTNIYKSVRNIPGVSVLPVSDLNALAVLGPRKLLVTKAALDVLKAG